MYVNSEAATLNARPVAERRCCAAKVGSESGRRSARLIGGFNGRSLYQEERSRAVQRANAAMHPHFLSARVPLSGSILRGMPSNKMAEASNEKPG